MLTDVPLRAGYLEGSAGLDSAGPFARGELGLRFRDNLGAFAFGERRREGWSAGAGVRYNFRF